MAKDSLEFKVWIEGRLMYLSEVLAKGVINIPDEAPCGTCNLEGICEDYGYQMNCAEWAAYINSAASNTPCTIERICINCRHFNSFTGACKVHMGAKENNDTCDDWTPLEGEDCKVKGCSCK